MSKLSAIKRVDLCEKLRADMKYCLISNTSADWCLANATGQPFSFACDFFAKEAERRHSARIANTVRNAGFPILKRIDDYDMSELRLPEMMDIDYLTGLQFIKDKHTLVMHGICGSGKTMLSICLGMLACNRGYRVRFFTLAQLAVKLKQASQEERLENMLLTLKSLDLLIIDEWGYTAIDSESASYIYRVIADSYEQKSLIITTNLPFSDWGRLFADEQLAAAIIDRIVHYGHLIDTGKKDWRLSNSPMNGKQFIKAAKQA